MFVYTVCRAYKVSVFVGIDPECGPDRGSAPGARNWGAGIINSQVFVSFRMWETQSRNRFGILNAFSHKAPHSITTRQVS